MGEDRRLCTSVPLYLGVCVFSKVERRTIFIELNIQLTIYHVQALCLVADITVVEKLDSFSSSNNSQLVEETNNWATVW